MASGSDGDFGEYRRLLLSEIERLDGETRASRERIEALERANVVLQVKSGLWGLVAGALTTVGALLLRK